MLLCCCCCVVVVVVVVVVVFVVVVVVYLTLVIVLSIHLSMLINMFESSSHLNGVSWLRTEPRTFTDLELLHVTKRCSLIMFIIIIIKTFINESAY